MEPNPNDVAVVSNSGSNCIRMLDIMAYKSGLRVALSVFRFRDQDSITMASDGLHA